MSESQNHSPIPSMIAVALASFATQAAPAVIVYVDVPDAAVAGQELDMDGDGQPNIVFGLAGDPGAQEISVEPSQALFIGGSKFYTTALVGHVAGEVAMLSAGVEVSLLTNSFIWVGTVASFPLAHQDDPGGVYPWSQPGDGYMAVAAMPLGSDFWHFGWVHLERPSDSFDLRITGFAYESTVFAPIVTGAVPAPGTIVLGALPVLRMSRRRN